MWEEVRKKPFNFDWNADVPDLTNEISLPDSSAPPLKDATLSPEDPQNRFTQVQHAWRHRSLKQPGQGSIWRCIARSAPPRDPSAESSDAIFSQSHRVDENCRQRLIGSFNSALASTYLGEGSAPGHLSVEFPSSETLGYALEQYFVYFHPMLPFVHLPTFRVQTTPTPLLLSMCLIGLSVLRNGNSSDFVSGAFEHEGRVGQTHALCVTTLSSHGLLSASEDESLDELLGHHADTEVNWKAWSRLESAKRLVIGLLEIDLWFSHYLSEPPITQPDNISLLPPAEDALFSAPSPEAWTKHHRQPSTPITTRSTPSTTDPPSPLLLLLLLLALQTRATHHRLLPATSPLPPHHLYPPSSPLLTTTLALTPPTTFPPLLLHHALHIAHLAPLPLLSLAAGRSGPAAAAAPPRRRRYPPAAARRSAE
ncbi:hypothetical protein CC78DRAFT_557294, partial [Neofusicoccum parvum]